jgi:hypothetical protein
VIFHRIVYDPPPTDDIRHFCYRPRVFASILCTTQPENRVHCSRALGRSCFSQTICQNVAVSFTARLLSNQGPIQYIMSVLQCATSSSLHFNVSLLFAFFMFPRPLGRCLAAYGAFLCKNTKITGIFFSKPKPEESSQSPPSACHEICERSNFDCWRCCCCFNFSSGSPPPAGKRREIRI